MDPDVSSSGLLYFTAPLMHPKKYNSCTLVGCTPVTRMCPKSLFINVLFTIDALELFSYANFYKRNKEM